MMTQSDCCYVFKSNQHNATYAKMRHAKKISEELYVNNDIGVHLHVQIFTSLSLIIVRWHAAPD